MDLNHKIFKEIVRPNPRYKLQDYITCYLYFTNNELYQVYTIAAPKRYNRYDSTDPIYHWKVYKIKQFSAQKIDLNADYYEVYEEITLESLLTHPDPSIREWTKEKLSDT